jgi:hypothetical protein
MAEQHVGEGQAQNQGPSGHDDLEGRLHKGLPRLRHWLRTLSHIRPGSDPLLVDSSTVIWPHPDLSPTDPGGGRPFSFEHKFAQISFKPDLVKFGMTGFDDDMVALFTRRAYDMAGVAGVKAKPAHAPEYQGHSPSLSTFSRLLV